MSSVTFQNVTDHFEATFAKISHFSPKKRCHAKTNSEREMIFIQFVTTHLGYSYQLSDWKKSRNEASYGRNRPAGLKLRQLLTPWASVLVLGPEGVKDYGESNGHGLETAAST